MPLFLKVIIYPITAMFLIANLSFWIILLYLTTFLRFLFSFSKAWRKICDYATLKIYHYCVAVHNFLFYTVLRAKVNIKKDEIDFEDGDYILVANHSSYFDIFLIQTFVCSKNSFGKFFLKQELRWHPLVGPIAYAYNFPFIYRKKDKEKNREAIQKSLDHENKHGTTIIFPEGTRFNDEKRTKTQSPFQNLLMPKYKGIEYALSILGKNLSGVIDFSIAYSKKGSIFFKVLTGEPVDINIQIKKIPRDDFNGRETKEFLHQLWKEKDEWISQRSF